MFLFPLYWMVVTAVLPTSQVLAREPTLLPSLADIELSRVRVAFERKPLATWLTNSLLVTLGATAISLVISALAGYSLSRFRTRAQEFTGLTLLLTKMLPGSLIVIPFFIMASTFHLIDSLWALMLANAAVGVPFATWLLKGFFDGIPRDLEHAAMIDGCGHLTAFVYVIIPLARPGPRRVRDLPRDPVVVRFRVRQDADQRSGALDDHHGHGVVHRRARDRLVGADGRRRHFDGADGRAVPVSRAVPGLGHDRRLAALSRPWTPLTLIPGRLTLAALREVWACRQRLPSIPPRAPRSTPPRRRSRRCSRQGTTVYGVNTGFGLLARTRIDDARLAELQRALVRSHSAGHRRAPRRRRPCGSCSRSRPRRWRAATRACAGRWSSRSSRSPTPASCRAFRAQGSVGASGDLAPLAHLAAVLIGEGEARVGRPHRARRARRSRRAGLEPVELAPKEGLALLNGTQVSTALALAGLFAPSARSRRRSWPAR